MSISFFFLVVLATSALSAQPVNPNSIAKVSIILDYLSSLRANHKILSEQHSFYDLKYAQHIYDVTGKWPAMIGLDFYCENQPSRRPAMITTALNYWRAGGLVTISWHAGSPLSANPDVAGWSSVGSAMSQSDFDQVVTPGTDLYNKWLANVDVIAPFLQQLRDAGVVVLWRPYHEMDIAFWWGLHSGASYKKLWKNMYDRLTTHWGLNNLIWVWAPSSDPDTNYYSSQYTDLGGTDYYSASYTDGHWSNLSILFARAMGSKDFGITEAGLMPDPNSLQNKEYSFFMIWGGGWCDNQAYRKPTIGGPGNTPAQLVTLYTHPMVITRDEISLLAPPPNNIPPTCSFTKPSNGDSLTAPANVSVTVNASDADGSVSKVNLYQNDVLVGSNARAPYSWALRSLAAGTYMLKAVVSDNYGATTSSIIDITVKSAIVGIKIKPGNIKVTDPGESFVQIINLRGQVVLSEKIIGSQQLNLGGLAQGVYHVSIKNKNGIKTARVISRQ